MNERPLEGRTCLVTGATGGLGRELARAFWRAGCRMFLTGRSEVALSELGAELKGPDGRPQAFLAADLTDRRQIDGLVPAVQAALGSLDILVNCAGVFPVGPFLSGGTQDYDDCFDLNVKAPTCLCRAFGAGMIAQGWGRVVNIASSSAYAGFRNTALYCASKHALLGLSRALHDEWKQAGVRVFCVSPGSIATPMGTRSASQDPDTFLDPAEVAEFVVSLVRYDGNLVAEEVRLNRMVIR